MKLALISSAVLLAAVGSASAASVTNSLNITSNSNNSTVSVKLISFTMVVSKVAITCLPEANAQVSIQSSGTAEDMVISATGLPPSTAFNIFLTQVPNAPFGLSWYQGDLETDDNGTAMQHFRGRFNIETFTVAPGIAAAPIIVSNPPFPDAAQNQATGPVHIYHLGFWFNSPIDAQKAGCSNTVTQFNGEHNAGIQVLNTSNFPDNSGPLRNMSR
jgi:hypothetical protein